MIGGKAHVFIAARMPKNGVLNNPTEDVVVGEQGLLDGGTELGLQP